MSSLAGVRANNLNNAQDAEFPNSVLDGATPGVTGGNKRYYCKGAAVSFVTILLV